MTEGSERQRETARRFQMNGDVAARHIEFGIGALSAQTPSPGRREVSETLALVLDVCELSEELGLDSVWMSEHHFADDNYLPSPITLLAAAARNSSRIRLSSNVLIGPLYDPLRLAEDAAIVDQLSRGRLMLGLGLGYREVEFSAFGVQKSDRVRRLESLVRFLKNAWSGADLSSLGRTAGGPTPTAITPLPYNVDGPPLLIGAFAQKGIDRARRIGDGWITPELGHPRQLLRGVAGLDLSSLDRPFHVAVTMNCFVAAHDAWSTVRGENARVATQYRLWLQESGDIASVQDRSFDADADTDGRPPQFVAGTPAECIEQLRPWCEALATLPQHVTCHVTLRMLFPGVARAATVESVRLLAQEVIPALRALPHDPPSD